MAKQQLGYIGLGAMGMPMALNFLEANWPLTVWGRTPAKLSPAIDAGAELSASPQELMAKCDIVFACVTNTEAVEDVVFGHNGIAAGAAESKLFVDMSTIHPMTTRHFAERLKSETGAHWVDAPVSGGARGAKEGTLVIMAGGEEADVDRLRPVVEPIAQRLTYMGPAGAGQATKSINQMLIAAEIAVIAEALNFAQNFGVSARALPDCLAGGWADSAVLQDHARRMAAAQYASNASINMLKDINIAQDMGQRTSSPMPVTSLVADLYRLAAQQGHAAKGQIALMGLYRDGPLD